METSRGFSGVPIEIHTSMKKVQPDADVTFVREVYIDIYDYAITLTKDYIEVCGS